MGSIIDLYREVDALLSKESRVMQGIENYVEPVNEVEEKKKFFEGKAREPKFKYPFVYFDPKAVRNKIESIHIPEGELHEIYERKKEKIITILRMIENRGHREHMTELSEKLYGKPEKETIKLAKKILRRKILITGLRKPRREVSSEVLKEVMGVALKKYGLKTWRVELSSKKLVTVHPVERRITIGYDRWFSKKDVERLIVHEIGVHALRAENGFNQPLRIFVTGFPSYLSTEEGLAIYFEKRARVLNLYKWREYAARVLAIDMVYNGHGFREVFDKIKAFGFGDEKAWDITVRVFRGGGFLKDHVYLQGFNQVSKVMKDEKNIRLLYTGKVGIKDMPLIEHLLEIGEINKPLYLPKMVRRLDELTKFLKYTEQFITDSMRKMIGTRGDKSGKNAFDLSFTLRKWKAALWPRV